MVEFLPKQLECLRSLANDAPSEVVLFGGAAGGSKSFTGCAWQIQRRLKYAGTRGLIGRSKLDALKKTTLRTFFEVASLYKLRSGIDYIFNGQSNIISFSNGSEIILKDLFLYPSDPSFDSLGGYEITDWFCDEASQISKRAIDVLRSRVRYKLKHYDLLPKGLLTCNPSKGWLYNDFYAPWKKESLSKYYSFIPATSYDNPYLPSSYIQTLSRLPEQERLRLLEGNWDYDETIDALFDYENILRCFREEESKGEMFISADIARLGKDRTTICLWKGLNLIEIFILKKYRINETVNFIRDLSSKHNVRLQNIICDEDGVGGGAVDSLRCRGFLNGSRAKHSDRYTNLKSECYYTLAERIEQNQIVFPEKHKDDIVKELDMIRRKNMDKDGKLSVTGKDEIGRMHGISPDIADAIMMRMFFELTKNYGIIQYI
jgi:phage terminase large subunit